MLLHSSELEVFLIFFFPILEGENNEPPFAVTEDDKLLFQKVKEMAEEVSIVYFIFIIYS